ncbi:MAG: ABC transporter permease [Pikeienuella sp.]
MSLARSRVVLSALLAHWRRHPLQALAALAGLMLATALWSGVQALNAEAKRSYAEAAAVLDSDRLDRLLPVAEGRLDGPLFAALRLAGWPVSPVIEGTLRIGDARLRLVGIDPLTLPPGSLASAVAGAELPDAAAALAGSSLLLAAPETLSRLGLAPGAEAEDAQGRQLPPLYPAARLAPDLVVTDISVAARLLGPDPTVLLLDPEASQPQIPWQEIAAGALRLEPAGADSALDRMTASFHLNLAAFGFLAFCVGLLITHSAVGLAFEQRLGLMRSLRAMGVGVGELTAILLAEVVLAACLAGALGLLLGWLVAALLAPGVSATLAGLYGAPVSEGLRLEPAWWLSGLGMALLGALIAAGHRLAQVAAMPVLASGRRQAWRVAQTRTIRWQALGGIGALALCAVVATIGGGLVAGFAMIGTLLLGAVLLLPGLLVLVLAGLARCVPGPVAQWSVADARQQISGLSLALMALLVALATNIGVGTMVESFRTTFTDWLDQRLFADVYVNPADGQRDAVGSWLATRPEVAELLWTTRVEVTVGDGVPVDLVGRPADSAYREAWPFLAARLGAWDEIHAGRGAMLSEQLARRLGLGLGDLIELPAPEGRWALRVVALYADYGNPRGEIGVGRQALAARWPGARFDGFGAVLAPEQPTGPLMAALGARFDLGSDALIDQAGVKAFSLRVFDRTFAVTALLNLLTLGVAGVALFTSLLTLADLRLTALAPLWASGLTRRRLASLELGKTVALALATGVLAVPFGLALAWLLIAVVNVEAFGWRLPFHVFPGQWAVLLGLTLLTAALASAPTAWRLARLAPARLAKLFAEER